MKKITIAFLLLIFNATCIFSQEQASKKCKDVEFGAFVANTTNFEFVQNFIPRIGYSRTFGTPSNPYYWVFNFKTTFWSSGIGWENAISLDLGYF